MRLIWLRVALFALGALLGVALSARGAVLIGGIILVMAVLRAVMLVSIVRRRRRFVAARAERRGRGVSAPLRGGT